MMTPFLKQIACLFSDRYGAEIYRLAFVFPNRRSGVFFRKYLAETVEKPVFSPTVLTISDLFARLNPRRPADRVELLFRLYEVYRRRLGGDGGRVEAFDDFVYWGGMLLNDFDELDKYLVDAKQLFTNLKNLNEADDAFSYLEPAQIRAIRSFWSSFQPENHKGNQHAFLSVWEALFPIYTDLRENLAAEGLAYEGMVYREVIEHFSSASSACGDVPVGREALRKLRFEKIVFVGLNALTQAERMLLKYVQQEGLADFYWDYASVPLQDEANHASLFMRENVRMFPSAFSLPQETFHVPQIEVIGLPSRIGQAKQLFPLLENLTMSAGEALQTAVVLPDEQLLMPVLNAIPPTIGRINVTLGYPLSGTPVASLMNILQSLQQHIRATAEDVCFYHRDVLSVLRHKYVVSSCPTEAPALAREITQRNQVYVSAASLAGGGSPFLRLLFSTPATIPELSNYLIRVLREINRVPDPDGGGGFADGNAGGSGEDAEATVSQAALEREFIYHYYTTVNRIHETICKTKTALSPATYFRLLKQVTDFIRIPFLGEPLSGLQIMGVLETRVLDFDTIFLLSANEGIFPAAGAVNSFIPYHLRKGFGLPAPEHRESIVTYHFYRMIQRARRVILLYDTRTDGVQSRGGEVSRFVHQLTYHYQYPVRRKVTVYDIASSRTDSFRVIKSGEIVRALAACETDKSLSASAINLSLDCPLKFYFLYLKGIDDDEVVRETLENDTFGTLLHRVLELVYQPFAGRPVTADLLRLSAQDQSLTGKIEAAFARDFFHTDLVRPLTGQAFLYGETIRRYVRKILAFDRTLTPFVHLNAEKRLHRTFELTSGRRIRLKGFIDRLDRLGETLRIIDYKSGRPSPLTFDTTESLFDPSAAERRKAILQVFLYAWLYTPEAGGQAIQPAVYYVRNLFKPGHFDALIRPSGGRLSPSVDDFEPYRVSFEERLRVCLDELFDPAVPFTQTSNRKNCAYCPFTDICDR
jgi:hypothetical protein